MFSAARQGKSVYVTRDETGQHILKAQLVPFVVSSIGLSCSEAHDVLRRRRGAWNQDSVIVKDSPGISTEATTALQDCLVVQHTKWIAYPLHRVLVPHRNSAADFIPPQPLPPC